MISGKVEYRRKKLTVDQKALRKVVRQAATTIKAKAKANAPKLSGALRQAIDFKMVSKKSRESAVIGVKSRFVGKAGKKKGKLPVLYAAKMEQLTHWLTRSITRGDLQGLAEKVQAEVVKMLKG